MHQSQVSPFNLAPDSQRKTTDIMRVDHVRLFGIQNLANWPSCEGVPQFSDVPRKPVECVRLLLPAKRPIEVVDGQSIDAHAVPVLHHDPRLGVQGDHHHLVMVTHKSLRQLGRSLFRSADDMGWVKRADYQHFHSAYCLSGSGRAVLQNHGGATGGALAAANSNVFRFLTLNLGQHSVIGRQSFRLAHGIEDSPGSIHETSHRKEPLVQSQANT